MSGKRYTEEFKIEAAKQVIERGYSHRDVARRLGITTKSLGEWIKKYGKGSEHAARIDDQHAEIKRLKAELKRVTEERDILKKATAYFAKESQ
jgi:transposase-like protein